MPAGLVIARAVQVGLICSLTTGVAIGAADQPVSFTRDIRPILESSCWKCHGGAVQLSKLDLRTREAALKGGARAPRSFPARPRRAGCTAWSPDWKSRPCRWTASSPPSRSRPSKSGSTGRAVGRRGRNRVSRAPGCSARRTRGDADLARRRGSIGRFRSRCSRPLPAVRASSANPIDRFLEKTRREKGLKAAPRADGSRWCAAPTGPDRAAADSRRNCRVPGRQLAAMPGSS